MDSVYRGWGGVRGGRGRGVKGDFFHTMEQKSSHCALMEVQKGGKCTCQAKKDVESSFTPSESLLVPPSGTAQPTVNCLDLQITKMIPVKVDPARYNSVNGGTR